MLRHEEERKSEQVMTTSVQVPPDAAIDFI